MGSEATASLAVFQAREWIASINECSDRVCEGMRSSLGDHQLDKLFVVYLAVAVHIGLPQHLLDLLVGELFAEVGHDVPELLGTYEAWEEVSCNSGKRAGGVSHCC
ncbi:SLC13 family permease [Babesia caballi]|uniref:SLC13 family permease n=1 Tax=Babesia caballi TaxID=5871 RepID=A0AAV4LZN8_BABCB|nr:SLC13 family permease [Babesia caballi]